MTHESSSARADQPAVAPSLETAGDLMTTAIVSVAIGTSVRDVARLLLEKRISAVPVLGVDQQLLGMVSEGDLVGRNDADRVARRDWWLALLGDGQPLAEPLEALGARPVEQVMRAPVMTIEAQAPLREIAEMFRVYDVKRLPVMRGGPHRGNRQPVGFGARHGGHGSAAGDEGVSRRLGRHVRRDDESPRADRRRCAASPRPRSSSRPP